MTGTALDMTTPRAGGVGPVYAVYGRLDSAALTLANLAATGGVLNRIPLPALTALETGSPALAKETIPAIAEHQGLPLIGAVGLDEYWNTALSTLNPGFPLAAARQLVTNKAALYTALAKHGATAPAFRAGSLDQDLLTDAVDRFGPRPILKPAEGAGSRGVYRYRQDLTVGDNLALYRRLLALGHIDSAVDIMAVAYVGGETALEISADVIVCAGAAARTIVHEKATATNEHPFVDRVMVAPPHNRAITEHLSALPSTIDAIIATLALADGILHVELRLSEETWYVLDVGIRPGAGLVAHSVEALTGVDPRLAHLRASLGQPLNRRAIDAAVPRHAAAALACCYVAEPDRDTVTFAQQTELAAMLRREPDMLGWHLNASEVVDQIYRPDAGLSIGLGAPTAGEALRRLRSIVEPFSFTTV